MRRMLGRVGLGVTGAVPDAVGVDGVEGLADAVEAPWGPETDTMTVRPPAVLTEMEWFRIVERSSGLTLGRDLLGG